MYTADDICKMMEFSIDDIFVPFGRMSCLLGYGNSHRKELYSITC